MDTKIKTEIWNQFGAALDMFENALEKCPDSLWNGEDKFWYIAFHTLFYTDYYLDLDPDKFHPPAPFTLSEFSEDEMPDRVYDKETLIEYTGHCREKCRKLLSGFTKEIAEFVWKNKWKSYSMFELIIYNMRHVQHHTGQLNLLLGRIDHGLPVWVSKTKVEL
jgi:hypothetical protein